MFGHDTGLPTRPKTRLCSITSLIAAAAHQARLAQLPVTWNRTRETWIRASVGAPLLRDGADCVFMTSAGSKKPKAQIAPLGTERRSCGVPLVQDCFAADEGADAGGTKVSPNILSQERSQGRKSSVGLPAADANAADVHRHALTQSTCRLRRVQVIGWVELFIMSFPFLKSDLFYNSFLQNVPQNLKYKLEKGWVLWIKS